jgi:hypothetical protein
MKPGSLIHFAANTPTGYGVPFAEDAYILIFKTKRATRKEEVFVTYSQEAGGAPQEGAPGGRARPAQGPAQGPPALRFAREVNPSFDPRRPK